MRERIKGSLLLLLAISALNIKIQASSLFFNNTGFSPIKIVPAASTGITELYVLHDLDNVSITYTSENNAEVEWSVYENMGGAYAEPIPDLIKEGNSFTLLSPKGNAGYIIRDNGRNYIFWLVDYSKYNFSPQQLSFNNESTCDATIINFEGKADPIYFFSINGRQEILSRDIELHYTNQVWNSQDYNFELEAITDILPYINNSITLVPPVFCNTNFELEGDRFLKEWGIIENISSPTFSPIAVDVNSEVITENENIPDNQIGSNNEGLGGSAPYTTTFYSFVTQGVVHYEWQMSEDPSFENISYRFNDKDLTYTFNDEGVTYIRFVGSNSDGSCESFGDVYNVTIGASELLIPNVFSPNGDGVNDIWKVSYRSLIEFRCQIYDRHGHQIYHFENPDGGWDGKNGSKFVNPGVYFYVIEATGADGKKYKKSGDINILNSINTNIGTETY